MHDSEQRAASGEREERFVVRGYQAGDETAILDLFGRSFHAPRSLDHFRWKYQHNPFGNQHISVAFDADARLVGHYAGYVIPFFDRGEERIAHQIGDTMTERSVRHVGRGPTSILGRTALHFYENFCESQVAFNYGFNVANIQKFSLQFLRSDRVEPVPYRVRDLRRDPIPRIGRLGRWPRGYQLEQVHGAGEEYDAFFARVAPAYRFLARRDAAYLRWRYLESPESPYVVIAVRKWRRLVGWSVFRVRDRRLSWGDALFDPRYAAAVDVLLRHIVPGYPVDSVEGWFASRPVWFDSILTRFAFRREREPQDLSLMCVPFSLHDATERMRNDLYYTMGDSDLY
jgi:hypothetical protein